MPDMKLLKEPGYIYDLMYIFCHKFNSKIYIENIPDNENKESYVKKLNNTLASFGEVPDDLYVFFHALESKSAFLPTYYFYPYQNNFLDSYDFKFLQKELLNKNKLIRNLIKFYFYEFDEETIVRCEESLGFLFSCIKKSEYSEEEKNRLYEFFMDPDPYIQQLQYELMAKEIKLSEYYKDNYQKIIDIYNQTTIELLEKQLKQYKNINVDFNNAPVSVSYCLLYAYFLYILNCKDSSLSLLGCNYISFIESANDEKNGIDLYTLGVALADESRVKIFEFILEKGEIICKDLEKAFSFSGSTAYHHITIMTRSGLIKTRNEGKTILYSVNKDYVAKAISTFDKILKTKGK